MRQQLPPPPVQPQISVTRTKSAVNVNIIATGVVFLTIFGLFVITSFRDSLAVAVLWTGRALAAWVAGWALVKIASGAVGVWHKAKTYGLERQARSMELQERQAAMWKHSFIDIGANGSVYFNGVDFEKVAPFYASQRQVIEPQPTALALPEPEQRESLFDLMPYAEHWLMVGSTQSGKTTAMIHLANEYHRQGAIVTVLDIHAVKNPWPGHFNVIGKGRDFETVASHLQKAHAELTRRSKTGQDTPEQITIVDEWLAVVDNCMSRGFDVRQYMRELAQEGAKFGLRLILAGQGDGVEELGAQGRKSVRNNFRRVYFSHRWKLQNKAALDNTKDPDFIDLPGPYRAAQLPPALSDDERILAAAFNGASYRAISEAVGLGNGGNVNRRIADTLTAGGWQYDGDKGWYQN